MSLPRESYESMWPRVKFKRSLWTFILALLCAICAIWADIGDITDISLKLWIMWFS